MEAFPLRPFQGHLPRKTGEANEVASYSAATDCVAGLR
jgi:hypothetical protein